MLRAARAPSWRPGAAVPPPEASAEEEEERRRRRRAAEQGAPPSPTVATPGRAERRWRDRRAEAEPLPPRARHHRSVRELLRDATGAEPTSPRGALLVAAALAPVALSALAAHVARGGSSPRAGATTSLRAASANAAAAAELPPLRDAARLSVLSFNVAGVSGRWPERLPILRTCIAALQPDVVAFQDVLTGEAGQDAAILKALMDEEATSSGGGSAQAGPPVALFPCPTAMSHLARFGGYKATALITLVAALMRIRLLRRALTQLPAAFAAAREAAAMDVWPLPSLARALQLPFFGNSICVRSSKASVERHETLPLGHFRAAQRVLLTLRPEAAGAAAGDAGAPPPLPHRVWLVNTHLHHGGATPAEQHAAYAAAPIDAAAAAAVRREQAARLLAWMDAALAADVASGTPASAVIVAGDLNAPPGEPAQQLLAAWGLLAAHGGDGGEVDQPTWPTPLKAPFKEWGAPHALDFVLIRPLRGVRVRVVDARRVGGAAGADGQLFPSDHFGVLARFHFSRCDEEGADVASAHTDEAAATPRVAA